MDEVVTVNTARTGRDASGRDRMLANVLASWAGHFVFIIAGFVLPRFVSEAIGQGALGVWDFCWSVVTSFELVQGGINSSVNRYVARHRAEGDIQALKCAMASVNLVLWVAASIVLLLTGVVAWLVPLLLNESLVSFADDARWVIAMLGTGLAVQVGFVVFNGTITGCHRWGVHNAVNAGVHAVAVIGMIAVLLLDGGLRGMATCYLGCMVGGEVLRAVLACRICPEISIHPRRARWTVARSMMGFGGKSFMLRVSELLLNQAVSVLILSYLGPAMLALYSRPRGLVQRGRTLVAKFAWVLTPMASSIQATGDETRVRELLVTTARYAACMALPMVLTLAIFGDVLMRLWMGPAYVHPVLIAILSLGFLATIIGHATYSVLSGLNAHGGPGVARLVGALVSIALAAILLGMFDLGLVATALAVTIPLTIADGIYLPIHACRRTGVRVRTYFIEAFRVPLGCALPFAACLVFARALFEPSPYAGLACGLATGCVVLAVLYWRFVLPDGPKRKIRERGDWIRARLVGARCS